MRMRNNIFLALAAGLALSGSLSAQEKMDGKSSELHQTAGRFVEFLNKGDFVQATKDFDGTMQKVLPPEELKKAWKHVLDEAGAYRKQLSARSGKVDKYDVVYITCKFAKARWDARV